MSEMATEISGSREPITTIEFLGSTFEERKRALAKVNAFKKIAEQAMADSVSGHIGKQVIMSFRPSTAYLQKYNVWVPCYSLNDTVREPITQEVTVRDVHQQSMSATISQGEAFGDQYELMWTVSLNSIVSIEPIEQTGSNQ